MQDMQDSCIGTHVAVWFAAFLPFTHIWHFSPCYPSLAPPLHCPSRIPPSRPQCVVLPSLCPCALTVPHPPMSENMWCLIFCSFLYKLPNLGDIVWLCVPTQISSCSSHNSHMLWEGTGGRWLNHGAGLSHAILTTVNVSHDIWWF